MFIVGLIAMFALGFVMMAVSGLFSRPEPYKAPNVGSVDPGLQFSEQYNTKTSQVPVPIIFGVVRVTGNIIYENIGGDTNDVLYTCVGLGEQSMISSIGTVWVDDIEWDKLPSAARAKSILEKFPDGGPSSFDLNSSGSHGFGFTLSATGDEETTYPIQLYGDGSNVTLKATVYKGNEQISASFSLYYKQKDATNWTLVDTYSGDWWWTYSGGKGDGDHIVPHSWSYAETLILDRGEYVFRVVLNSISASSHEEQRDEDGNDTWSFSSWVRLDEVIVQDTGSSETFNFPETAYIKLQLTRDAALPSNTVIQAMVSGQYSNPAQCIKEFITNAYWGMGIPASVICTTCYNSAVNFCSTYGYRFDRCLGTSMNAREVLSEMCLAGRLMLLDYEGKIHIVPDQNSAAVKTITDDDILDLQYARPSITQNPTRLVAKFNDASEEYTVQDIILDDVLQQDFRGVIKEQTLDLTGVTNRNVANQLAMFYMNKLSNDELVVVRLSINHSELNPGDVFNLTSSDAGWTAMPMRILGIEETEEMEVIVTCQPHHADVYDLKPHSRYTGDQRKPVYNPPSSIFPQKLPSASDLLIGDEQYRVGESITCDLVLTFTKPGYNCDYCEIWLSRGSYGQWSENPYKMIGTSVGEFRYAVEEYWTLHRFKVVSVFGSNKNPLDDSPVITCSPKPLNPPGYGAGNYGMQWYGY